MRPGRRVVALTFDDGPNGADTASILDVLAQEDVRATFFVVGQAAKEQPHLLHRMVRDGHAIGNHSWSHTRLNLRSRAAVRADLQRTDEAIFAATGERTRLVRPPFGARSFALLAELRRLGYTCVLWSVPLAREWDRPDAASVARRLLDATTDGSIVALHDGNRGRRGDRSHVAAAVRTVVRELRDRSLRFLTIPEMVALGEPR